MTSSWTGAVCASRRWDALCVPGRQVQVEGRDDVPGPEGAEREKSDLECLGLLDAEASKKEMLD